MEMIRRSVSAGAAALLVAGGIGITSAVMVTTTVLPAGATTDTYNYTGSAQSWTVPTGVTSITIDAQGAQGGTSGAGSSGGNGGRVVATIAVTPGDSVEINVGGQGIKASAGAVATGGFNGGGDSGAPAGNGNIFIASSGGGASDVRVNGTGLANRVVVAAGGGGASGAVSGGAGGPTGLDGGSGSANGGGGGAGATIGAGGTGGAGAITNGCTPTGSAGVSGSSGNGGAGGDAGSGNSFSPGGGGGGGGYFGGGGGGGACNQNLASGAGGGGSNYPDAATPGVTSQQGVRSGDGVVTITYTVTETTTTTLVSTGSPSTDGDSVTFTAASFWNNGGTPTGVPGGTIEFTADGTTISGCGAVAVDGVGEASCTTNALAVGTHPVVANYSGTSGFASSSSNTLNHVVLLRPTVSLTPSANPIQVGRTLSLTVAVSGSGPTPTGTIQVNENGLAISGSCNLAPLVNGSVTCTVDTLSVGDHELYVNYSGDSNYGSLGIQAQYTQEVTSGPTPTTAPPSTTTPPSTTAPPGDGGVENASIGGLPFTGASAAVFALLGIACLVGGSVITARILQVRRRRPL